MQTRCGGRFPDQRPHAVDGPTDLAHGLAEPALVGFLPLDDLLARPVLVVRRLFRSYRSWSESSRANTHETSGDVCMLLDCGSFAKALAGTLHVLGDAAAWAVRRDAVYVEFREKGHDVHRHADVFKLDLEQVDAVVGWLDAKYTGLAFAEGATAGAAGVPGLIADIPALVTLNLRAIAEYATYYGFDVASQRERVFAMNVLGLASSPSDAAKAPVMAQLARIAADAAKKKAWKTLEEHAFVEVVQQIARALGIRLTKAKLAQAVPIMGAAVGGGFNAYYTARVCDAAYHLYRERFLAKKYGPGVIDLTAEPAEGAGIRASLLGSRRGDSVGRGTIDSDDRI